ncbi:MAG: hypothetical protein QGF53_11970, partial [Alphaproteobacteria bacterium]|nr:hypothetical protein [Alphaproteobacteria bacterium]
SHTATAASISAGVSAELSHVAAALGMVGLAPCSNLMGHRRGAFALRVNMRYRSTIATALDIAYFVSIG